MEPGDDNYSLPISQQKKTLGKTGKIFLIIIGSIFGLILLFLIFLTTPYFTAMVGGMLTNKSGRDVTMEGNIETKIWTSRPRLILNNIKVGNAKWAKSPTMFEAKRIEVAIRPWPLLRGRMVLEELIADKPKLFLEKNKEGKKNWDFSENPESEALEHPMPEERDEVPIINYLKINQGEVQYLDPAKEISTVLKVTTITGEAGIEEQITINGDGSYGKEPFKLNFTGASVLELRDVSNPYPLELDLTIGRTIAKVKGTVQDPVQLQAVDVVMELKGANAADLFPFTGIALPPTPSYSVSGHLLHQEEDWRFIDFKGRMGTSDLSGDVAWHPKQERPYFEGKFVSQNLDLKDLSGFIGAQEEPKNDDRVIPDQPMDITRMMAMDADISFRGTHVREPRLLDNFLLNIRLRNGVLNIKPVSFGIGKGTITAYGTINGRAKPPDVILTVDFRRLALQNLFSSLAKKYGEKNVSSGLLGGKAKLKGKGKSLREILATSNGTIGFGMEGGTLSGLLLELIGLDIYRAAGLILSGDKPIDINCVVGDFAVNTGLMQTREFLVDTDVTTIRGKGSVNLKNENLDMTLNVYPKDSTLISARSPILIRGTLKNPSVGIDPAALAARGAIATALGALLTPAASLLAFVEPGLGKDSNCASFIINTNKHTGTNIPVTKPQLKVIKSGEVIEPEKPEKMEKSESEDKTPENEATEKTPAYPTKAKILPKQEKPVLKVIKPNQVIAPKQDTAPSKPPAAGEKPVLKVIK